MTKLALEETSRVWPERTAPRGPYDPSVISFSFFPSPYRTGLVQDRINFYPVSLCAFHFNPSHRTDINHVLVIGIGTYKFFAVLH